MLGDFYKNLDNADKTTIFIYISVFIIFLWISKFLNINLSIILCIFISITIIFYFDYRKQDEKKTNKEMLDKKYNVLRPKSTTIEKYSEIIDFLYSIQEMYVYNPQSFEELIENINEFFENYEYTIKFPEIAGKLYSILEVRKTNSLNSLHSIIYNLPSNKFFENKLERAVEKLDSLLSYYLDEVVIINDNYNKSYGFTNNSVIINKGPKEVNYYDNKPYTFDVFT